MSSCVCLLELCSLDTEMLRVDVQTAKRIYLYQDSLAEKICPQDIIDLFLSFPEVTPQGKDDGKTDADKLKDDGDKNAIEIVELDADDKHQGGGKRPGSSKDLGKSLDDEPHKNDEDAAEDGFVDAEDGKLMQVSLNVYPPSGLKTNKSGDAGDRELTAMNSPALLTSLRMLEEATWALDPHPAEKGGAVGLDSPWHLVALFCRVHSLPRSLTLLHEL